MICVARCVVRSYKIDNTIIECYSWCQQFFYSKISCYTRIKYVCIVANDLECNIIDSTFILAKIITCQVSHVVFAQLAIHCAIAFTINRSVSVSAINGQQIMVKTYICFNTRPGQLSTTDSKRACADCWQNINCQSTTSITCHISRTGCACATHSNYNIAITVRFCFINFKTITTCTSIFYCLNKIIALFCDFVYFIF